MNDVTRSEIESHNDKYNINLIKVNKKGQKLSAPFAYINASI